MRARCPLRLAELPLVLLVGALVGTLVGAPARSQDAAPLSSADAKEGWHGRLDRRAFRAELRLDMVLAGLTESRQVTVFRDDEEGMSERVMVRFDAPADLRDVRLLYREIPDRSNDYFIYVPATRRVRRLPPTVADDDLYGIDLEFLGFGVAETEPTEILEMTRTEVDGRAALLLRERAKERNPRFEERRTWLDVETFIPLRTEHYRRGRLAMRAETRRFREIGGIATPTEMYFVKPHEGREVTLHLESVDYDTPLSDEVFTVLEMTKRYRHSAAGR